MTELSPIATFLSAEYHATEGPYAGRLRAAGRAVGRARPCGDRAEAGTDHDRGGDRGALPPVHRRLQVSANGHCARRAAAVERCGQSAENGAAEGTATLVEWLVLSSFLQ